MNKKQIEITHLVPPRADLFKEEFDRLIEQKGNDVVIEKALECPCKSPSTNQQSTCKNCGGSGWIFINPTQTRMVVSSINIVTDFKPWSEEMRGTVNITCKAEEELSAMDKITVLNGEAIFNEVLFFRKKGDKIFCYTTYNVKKVLYVGLYQGEDQPLKKLVEGVDFSVRSNIIELLDLTLLGSDTLAKNTSFTIRYKHAPEFHVIEMKRETMQSIQWRGAEILNNFPVSAIARRAHYQLKANNLLGDRLIDNSYIE
jgi:hypothetical protein